MNPSLVCASCLVTLGTGVISEHHSWNGSFQTWPLPSENPVAGALVGCHTAKPVWLGPACPWVPSCHPPCPVHGRGPHLAAAGRSSSSPKSSPRSRGDRRLRWLPWQRRQKWWASWRRSSACGCGRAGGASKALARWPHSSRPGVSVAEGTQEKNGQFGRLGHPLASHRSPAPTNTQGMSCGSSLLPP